MQGVILAAGKGTRLRPITLSRSKAMAPVAGKPMIERVLETCVENGITDFVVVVSDEDNHIRPYLQQQSTLAANFQFVIQKERLGMAHALGLAAPYLSETFLMSACDSIVPVSHIAALQAAHRTRHATATLSLMTLPMEQVSKSSAVELTSTGLIARIVEKPQPDQAPSNIGSLPLYIFEPRILDYLPEVQPSPRGEYELQDAIQMLIERDSGVTGVITDSRVQLTTAADLLLLNRHYLQNGSAQIAANVEGQLIPPLRLESGVVVGPGCTIGPNVYLEAGCQLGANVTIREAVVLSSAKVAAGRTIEDEIVI